MQTFKAVIVDGVVSNFVIVDPENHDMINGVIITDISSIKIGDTYDGVNFSSPKSTVLELSNKLKQDAHTILINSDTTISRITQGVVLGTCSLSNADVIAYIKYIKDIRAIVSGLDITSTVLPVQPPYPSGT
jgi:hypothetical protein